MAKGGVAHTGAKQGQDSSPPSRRQPINLRRQETLPFPQLLRLSLEKFFQSYPNNFRISRRLAAKTPIETLLVQ